mmetsp:Transcript_3656/g.7847  ORF Transcript_3656/g.7847 Transcript_3656/m.7847 type:complete len:302 (-) Transcript_3656:710-1615(-)
METGKVSCCSWLCFMFKRRKNRELRQLHPIEQRNEEGKVDVKEEVSASKNKKDLTTNFKVTEHSLEPYFEPRQSVELSKKPTTVPPSTTTCEIGIETEASKPSTAYKANVPFGLSAKGTDYFVVGIRDLSPIPQDSSMHEILDCKSFSTNSEPAFKTEDPLINSFEIDQFGHFFNQSSERASLMAIKDQLDHAFQSKPKDSLNLKFQQLPIDPYEFENKPDLPDSKMTTDPFLQLYSMANPHLVKGRLRLKPITPDHFGKRIRLPTHKPEGPVNVLDELKRELIEESKLDEGSPAPVNIAL